MKSHPLPRGFGRQAGSFLLVDSHCRITFVGRTACEILGVDPEQVLGSSCHEVLGLLRPGGRPLCGVRCSIQSALARRFSRVEHHCVRRPGGDGPEVCLTSVPLYRPSDGAMAVLHFVVRASDCGAADGAEHRAARRLWKRHAAAVKKGAPVGAPPLRSVPRRPRADRA